MGTKRYTNRSERSAPEGLKERREMISASIRAKDGEGNERKFELSFSSEEPLPRGSLNSDLSGFHGDLIT